MGKRNKLIMTIVLLTTTFISKAHTISGTLISNNDSQTLFGYIQLIDSAEKVISTVPTNQNGKFSFNTTDKTSSLKIIISFEYVEIQVINLDCLEMKTIDLGVITVRQNEPILNVQYKGISKFKERRLQRQSIKDYNKRLENYKKREIKINNDNYSLKPVLLKQIHSERLILVEIFNICGNE